MAAIYEAEFALIFKISITVVSLNFSAPASSQKLQELPTALFKAGILVQHKNDDH